MVFDIIMVIIGFGLGTAIGEAVKYLAGRY